MAYVGVQRTQETILTSDKMVMLRSVGLKDSSNVTNVGIIYLCEKFLLRLTCYKTNHFMEKMNGIHVTKVYVTIVK